MTRTVAPDEHVDTWWVWFTVALFLLLPLDLLTTLFAVAEYGVAAEANPAMELLLRQGFLAVVGVHLVVIALVVYLFHIVVARFRLSDRESRRLLSPIITAWIIMLNVAGVIVVTNNILLLV